MWTCLQYTFSFTVMGMDPPDDFETLPPILLYVLSTGFVNIIMLNMLIAIMGDKFEQVQEKAHVLQMQERVKLLRDLEDILPNFILRQCSPAYIVFAQPVDTHGAKTLWTGFSGEIKKAVQSTQDSITENLTTAFAREFSHIRNEISDLRADLRN